jgi:hypothetical protein
MLRKGGMAKESTKARKSAASVAAISDELMEV